MAAKFIPLIKTISQKVIASKSARGDWPPKDIGDYAAFEAAKETIHAFPYAEQIPVDNTADINRRERAKYHLSKALDMINIIDPKAVERVEKECEK